MSVTQGVLTVIPPPKGYVVDFAHPNRQGTTEIYWIVAVGNILALAFLAQKIYTKVCIDRRFQADDACHIAAWATSVGTQAVLLRGFVAGVIGVHAWELPLERYNYYSLLILIAPVAYAPCSGFAKLTLLLFYQRLSPQRGFLWAVNASILIVVSYTVGIFFSLIFACSPVEKSWNVLITTGSCINRPALYIITAVLGVVTDILLLALPIPMVLRLQMPTLQKAGLLLMFAIGSLTLVTSVVRLVILMPTLTDMDQTWIIASPCLWVCIEANLLIICGSFPTLQRFLRRVAPTLIGEGSEPSRPGAAKPKRNSGLHTFGDSGPRKHGYDKFGESDADFDLTTIANTEGDGDQRPNIQHDAHSVQIESVKMPVSKSGGGHEATGDAFAAQDGGIIKTTKTVIDYEMTSYHANSAADKAV